MKPHLYEEGHEGESNPTSRSHGLQFLPQPHQLGQVDLIAVPEVRDLQGCSHGLHHGLLEAWKTVRVKAPVLPPSGFVTQNRRSSNAAGSQLGFLSELPMSPQNSKAASFNAEAQHPGPRSVIRQVPASKAVCVKIPEDASHVSTQRLSCSITLLEVTIQRVYT